MKRKTYLCKKDRCVWRYQTGTGISFCPFIGCIYETDKPMFMVVNADDIGSNFKKCKESAKRKQG